MVWKFRFKGYSPLSHAILHGQKKMWQALLLKPSIPYYFRRAQFYSGLATCSYMIKSDCLGLLDDLSCCIFFFFNLRRFRTLIPLSFRIPRGHRHPFWEESPLYYQYISATLASPPPPLSPTATSDSPTHFSEGFVFFSSKVDYTAPVHW